MILKHAPKEKDIQYRDDPLEYPRDILHKIVFLDESKNMFGSDKRWVWWRRGDDNPVVIQATIKFPP
jgi:hypothetical protein